MLYTCSLFFGFVYRSVITNRKPLNFR